MAGRKRYLVFAILPLLVVALSLLGLYFDRESRQKAFETNWAAVCVGMSRDEVRELLGEPDSLYPAGIAKSNSFVSALVANLILDSMREKWAYGERRFFTLGFDVLPENDDRVLYFSYDGKVAKKLYPYREPEPETRSGVNTVRLGR